VPTVWFAARISTSTIWVVAARKLAGAADLKGEILGSCGSEAEYGAAAGGHSAVSLEDTARWRTGLASLVQVSGRERSGRSFRMS
jgi:hypothetical protein